MKIFSTVLIVITLLTPLLHAKPIGLYTFEGNANDSSGNGNHATTNGTLAFDTGHEGQALDNDQTVVNYVNLPLDIRPGIAPRVTIGCWVDADALDNNDVIMSTDNGAYDRSISIDARGGYRAYSAFIRDGVMAGKHAELTDGFVFVAAVFDQASDAIKLYTDGGVTTTAGHIFTDNWNYIRVGSLPNNAESINASIDNVFVINTALTDKELYRIYKGGASVLTNMVPAGELWQIDFEGNAIAITCSGIGAGDNWVSCNVPNWTTQTPNPSWNNINDSTGAGSTLDFRITGTISAHSGDTAAYNPICSDYIFWNVGGTSADITWALTGLNAGETYEIVALGALTASRKFNLRADTDADGSLTDETAVLVYEGLGRGAVAVYAKADNTGKIIGDAQNTGDEANWGGLTVRRIDKSLIPSVNETRYTVIAVNQGNNTPPNGTDLRHTGYSAVDVDNNSGPDIWNNFGDGIADGVAYTNILDIDGNVMPYTITQTGVLNYNPWDGILDGTWNNRLNVPDEVMSSIQYAWTSFDVVLSGLPTNGTVRAKVEVFAALNANRDMDVSVIGKKTSTHTNFDLQSYFDNNTEQERARMVFEGIVPDSNGKITVRKEVIDTDGETMCGIRYTFTPPGMVMIIE